MKRKTITLVIYMLVCISLVSVGFAAWVITGGESTEATGNVTASTVTDKSLHTSQNVTFETGKQNINFGSPNESNDTSKWFQFDTADPQNLVAAYHFDLWVGDINDNNAASIASSLKNVVSTYEDSAIDSLIENGYISAPVFSAWWDCDYDGHSHDASNPIVKVTEVSTNSNLFGQELKEALTSDDSDCKVNVSKVTIYVQIEYKWGSKFNSMNPYTFFNTYATTGSEAYNNGTPDNTQDDPANTTYKQFALTSLKAIEEALENSQQYSMTLEFRSNDAQ